MGSETTESHRLRLVRKLGVGGNGQVWEARYGELERPVAAKLVSADQRNTPRTLEREVHAMAQLHHPNIVHVYDFGTILDPADVGAPEDIPPGCPFLVMDLARGSLRDRIDEGVLDWPAIRDVLANVLDALAHAHARYLVHRDVKPDNLLRFENDGVQTWKLSDFGIAHSVYNDLEVKLDHLIGTPHYMAPEQLTGHWREHAAPTDLYAVGCMAFELCCGAPPFDGDQLRDIAHAHLHEPVPPFEPDMEVPTGFHAWLCRMLSKDPLDRFKTAPAAMKKLLALDEDHAPTQKLQRKRGVAPKAPLESAPTVSMDAPLSSRKPVVRSTEELALLPSDDDWRTFLGESPPQDVSSARLHALRPLALVGRDQHQQVLWEAFRRAVDERRAQCVVIEGERGRGKSRLAEWFCHTVMELGGANYMHGFHSPECGHGEGLAFMVAQFSRATGLSSHELGPYLTEFLPRRNIYGSWAVDILTRFLAETTSDYTAESGPSVPVFRPAALARMLENTCQRHPVLVWLDDVQWGEEALDMMEAVFAPHGPTVNAPTVFIATAETVATQALPHVRKRLDALVSYPGCRRLTLDKLAPEAMEALLCQHAPVDAALLPRVVELVDGNPLFATQLVSDWVERGVLKFGSQGFSLREDATLVLDETLLDMWVRRIDSALEGRSVQDRHAIELAAVLGSSVATVEWHKLCERVGCTPSTGLVGHLVEQGLCRWTDDGWTFVHGMARESVLQTLGTEGRLSERHAQAADYLEELRQQMPRPGLATRLARHLSASDQLPEALVAWLDAAHDREAVGDFTGALALLDERQDTAEVLADELAQADGLTAMSLVNMRLGNLTRAASFARSAEAICRSEGDARRQGVATAQLADVHMQQGRFTDALSMAEAALALFEVASDAAGIAVAMLRIADCLSTTGNYGDALEAYRDAARNFGAAGDDFHEAWAQYGIGYVHMQRGEHAIAHAHLTAALEGYETAGASSYAVKVTSALADLARHRGDLEEAREGYERVNAFLEAVGTHADAVGALNLALLCFAEDDIEEATRWVDTTAAALELVPRRHLGATVTMCRLALAAAGATWETWDAQIEALTRALEETEALEYDDAWLCEHAADRTEKAGDVERARRLFTISAKLWAHLGLEDQATRSRARSAG